MAVCHLRTLFLIIIVLELVVTVERQIFDFLGYMWLPIIANFLNIILIIFGFFGAVQNVSRYLLAYAIWSVVWLTWNIFLICYYLNVGTLNRESGLLSLGTGSVSWWEGNGWGCQPEWGEIESPNSWRPIRVDGCLLPWSQVEQAQSSLTVFLTMIVLPLATLSTYHSYKKSALTKNNTTRHPVYTIELSPTDTTIGESSLKPMTPRRVKRRSGSRGAGSSVRRSRRSYRNAGYLASTASLPRDSRPSRPTSAHSSYSNYHGARPASYHSSEHALRSHDVYEPPQPAESAPTLSSYYNSTSRDVSSGYDVAGPFVESQRNYRLGRSYETHTINSKNRSYEPTGYDTASRIEMAGSPCESPTYGATYTTSYPGESAWEAPPPPAPPYCARATPQAPGPPAYQPMTEPYNSNMS